MLDCQTVDSSEMSDRLIGIVGMVRLSYYQTARIVGFLDCWILGFSDCRIVGLSEFSDCWTVDLSEMSDRLIGIVRMLRF